MADTCTRCGMEAKYSIILSTYSASASGQRQVRFCAECYADHRAWLSARIPSCDVGGGAEPKTFPQAMAEVRRLREELHDLHEGVEGDGILLSGLRRDLAAAKAVIERMKGDQDLLRDVVHHRDELMRERDEAQAAWAGVTEQWKHALGKLDEATEEIATLRLAIGTPPDAQVLSPLAMYPVAVAVGEPYPVCARCQRLAADCSCQPPLICPACGCVWPLLTPGTETTVTCDCGKVLGCKSRRKP